MTDREPIETYLRVEPIDDEMIVVVRGGPVTPEKFLEHAHRQAREFTFRGAPMYSISVNLTVAGWDLDALLAGPLASRSTYATATVGAVRTAGFELLPTFAAPHYDLLLPGGQYPDAERARAVFSDSRAEPVQAPREVEVTSSQVEVDIPCDPTQIDQTGLPWAFLDEAAHPERIVEGAIVVTGDAEDPVFARVAALTERPSGTKVHFEILPGDPLDYVEAMRRSHLLGV